MCLDCCVGGIGGRLVRHRHPRAAVPPFRCVSAAGGVDPQGSRLAHRRIRSSGLDEHVGFAVRHASGSSGSSIRLLCRVGRVRGGLCRAVGRGLGLRGNARSVRGGGLCMGRIGLRSGSVQLGGSRVGLGGIGGSVGRVGQRLRIASGLLRRFGCGLRRIGGILGLTCGGGGTLSGSSSRVGGILRCLRRTIGRVSRALRVFRCGSGILSSLLGVGGLRRIVRDIRLRLLDLLRIVLDIGIAEMVPIRAIPHQRIDHAVGERHQHARTVVRRAGPVCVEVREHGRRIVLLALPPRPILRRLEPQVADNQIALRLVRPTERMVFAVGFRIRLSRRLLRLADLAIRRGQIGFRLRDVLARLR